MLRLGLSPMERIAAEVRQSILDAWFYDAVDAYEQAAELLGVTGERMRLRAARQGLVSTRLLEPIHDTLMMRYVEQISDGRQVCLFTEDHDSELRRRWSRFAVAFMRRRPQRQRWVLQATVGLGTAGRQESANQLCQHIMDTALDAS